MSLAEPYKTIAERGCIYEFIEKDGTHKNDVLVVSSNSRATDKIISILMLRDGLNGNDVVRIRYNNRDRVVHCGCVTFVDRSRLGGKLAKVSDKVMDDISLFMASQLGIDKDGKVYKALYEDLLNRVLKES